MTSRSPGGPSVLIAHPSADLYGSDRVLLESVSAFSGAGWRVVVTIPASGPLVSLLQERGAEVVLCPSPVLRKSALRPLGLVRLLGEVVRGGWHGSRLLRRVRPSAVYVNTVTVPGWLVLGRLHRRPTVCHVHEGEASASAVVRAVLATPLLLAHRLIVNSRFSVGVLTSSFPRLARRAQVVYNGVPGPAAVVPARESLTGPLQVVYVGRLSPRKGVHVAIEAAAALRRRGVHAGLHLVGAVYPGYEWYEDQLRAQAERAGLGDDVVFHGFRSQVWDLVAAADVVVVPSTADEPFGNTAVEALLAARPVIASATSGLLEATEGYTAARTVPPGDAEALAEALQDVAERWPEVRAAAVQDAAAAERRHAPAVYQAQIVDIVQTVVSAS